MPELPEVETIARGVDERLRGDRIENTWFSEKPEPFKSSPRLMAADCPAGASTRSPRGQTHRLRSGGPGLQWIVHLGMTGRLLVADPQTPIPPHTHGILHLASGRELRFVDPSRFGRMELYGSHQKDDALHGHRAGALKISQEEFAALFRGRRTSIKAALLNQKLLQGVGNIYADESLFRAGIRPRRMASRLKRANSIASMPACRASSPRQLRWADRLFLTMWMRTGGKASSNSSIASICAPDSPAWYAGLRFGAYS